MKSTFGGIPMVSFDTNPSTKGIKILSVDTIPDNYWKCELCEEFVRLTHHFNAHGHPELIVHLSKSGTSFCGPVKKA